MKLRREEDGTVVLTCRRNEARDLQALGQELRTQIEQAGPGAGATPRLFPRYAEDAAVNDELHGLFFEEQRRQKLERADAFQTRLAAVAAAGGEVRLSPADLEQWLGLLTDLRFIYAGLLGIDAEGATPRLSLKLTRTYAIYSYLSGLQQLLLQVGFGVDEDPGWGAPRPG